MRVVATHISLWVAVWFFYVYFFSFNSQNWNYVFWFASFLLPITMGVSYYVVYKLIPQYLLTRKYGLLALNTFYTIVLSSYLLVLVIIGSYAGLSKFDVQSMPPMSKNVISVLILVYMIAGIAAFVSILNHNSKTLSRNKELENKILSTQLRLKEQELHYLKKQIHPHFLFNTLNTIYGLAMAESRHTPDVILKLSNLLDYILYQVDKPMVSLKDEVMHIQEYIGLEKIRFQDTLKVNFTAGEIDEKIQVAPMLLIPYIENAFKHGSIMDGFLQIEITIRVTNGRLDFSISNSMIDDHGEEKHGGIGLENIRKRLDLQYAGNYMLTSKIENNHYIVNLVIMNLEALKNE